MTDDDVVPHGIPLATFIDPAVQLDVAEFAKAHGKGFFVLVTNRAAQPRIRGKTEANPIGKKPPSISEEATGETSVFVLPLVKKPTNQSNLLRVGRGDACDVVVSDLTISKLHAYVMYGDDGFELLDAGSRNGTFVGDTQCNARGLGPATPLKPSSKVRFGSISLTFIDAAQLHTSARARAKK